MQWPERFYERKRGIGCPLCSQGRPDQTSDGIRFFAGEVTDAYLRRAAVQRGLAVVVWRGRHVAEPTELTLAEAVTYWQELLVVGRAIEAVMEPVKLNYNILGNSVPHLHTHVIPRYREDPRPLWPFPFPDPEPAPFPQNELSRDVTALRRAVGQEGTSTPV
ncbi:MAG: HIT family protein [Solirubrobacteraceae bacterium]